MRSVLIVGGSSAIGRALAHQFAQEGYELLLAGRDLEDQLHTAADLRVRYGVFTEHFTFDALDPESHCALIESAFERAAHSLRGVIVVHGLLPDQKQAQTDMRLLQQTVATNFLSPMLLLSLAANHLEKRRDGFLCAISSVAGDRGRQSNYIYGAAKGGISTFLQGLRQRMSRSNVTVLTVKPGFVDTAMTWGLPGMFLVASPQKIAADVYRAIEKEKSTIYTPWFWRGIMTIIRCIPERLFKKLKL